MLTAKRALGLAVGVALLAALAPGASAGTAAPQENVRHITNVPGSTGGHSVVEGDRLYVGAYGLGMTIFDISNPAAPTKIGEYKPLLGGHTPSSADPGARADAVPDAAVFDGRHIATLNGTGRGPGTQQTEFLDVTNPAAPKLLWRFSGGEGEAHNGDIVDARRLWLPSGSGGNNFVRIYDLNPLLQTPPAAPAKVYSGNIQTLWTQSPYRNGRPAGVVPTHIHDIEIYTDYNLLLREEEWTDQDGDGVNDPTYAKRDIALYAASQGYPAAAPAGAPANSAVYILDITTPSAPVVVNKIPVRDGHRYMHEAQFLQGNPHIMFTADENLNDGCEGKIYSWRLTPDLAQATFLDDWAPGFGTTPGVCSPHVFSSHGNHVFMGAYNAGLQVIDFTNPADLKRAGQYVAEGANSWGALYHKGYVYVGDFGGRGLDVFEFIPNPAAKGIVKVNNPAVTQVPGITETALEQTCDPQTPANGVDGLIVPIPADKRDGTHVLRSVGSGGGAPYDLNVYFYNKDCVFIGGASHNSTNADELGPIPEEGAFAVVDLVTGPTMWVYAQIDP